MDSGFLRETAFFLILTAIMFVLAYFGLVVPGFPLLFALVAFSVIVIRWSDHRAR